MLGVMSVVGAWRLQVHYSGDIGTGSCRDLPKTTDIRKGQGCSLQTPSPCRLYPWTTQQQEEDSGCI